MKSLKNKLTASMISLLVIGGSCLPTAFAGRGEVKKLQRSTTKSTKQEKKPMSTAKRSHRSLPSVDELLSYAQPARSLSGKKIELLNPFGPNQTISENLSAFTPSDKELYEVIERGPFIVETVPSLEELQKKYPEIARALDNFDYKGGSKSESFSMDKYFTGINNGFRNALISWCPQGINCLRGNRNYKLRRNIEYLLGKTGYVNYMLSPDNTNSRICGIVKKAVKVKQREEFRKEDFAKNIENSMCRLETRKYAVDPKILEYVNETYIDNGAFLEYSKKLCPSVTSYSIVFCMGTPWFVKYIVDDVKKQPSLQNIVNRGDQLLNLARNLQRAFFGTLVYRLHLPDRATIIRNGREVRYVGDVELDSPVTVAHEILG